MKPLIPLIILKAAMLMAIGGDGLVVFAVSVPEYIVGAAIGAWLAKHPFAPPMILSKVAELARHSSD